MNIFPQVFFLSILLMSCSDLGMAYIPDKDMIEKRFTFFLSKPIEIQGIYGNHDVNAVLFKYTTQDDNALKSIARNAKEKQWNIIYKTKNELVLYRKSTPRNEKVSLGSFGLFRVAFVAEYRQVCVGRFNHSNEKWAAKHFWPKYENCKRGADTDLNSNT